MTARLAFPSTINQHLAFITIKQQVTTPRYLHLILEGGYRFLRELSAGSGSTKGALTCADLRHLRLAIPSIGEQDRILRVVDGATRKFTETIKRAETEIELIREYRTRLIADVVTGKIDVRGHPDASENEGLGDEGLGMNDLPLEPLDDEEDEPSAEEEAPGDE